MPPKKNPPTNESYRAFKRDLAAGTLGRLYILHGEEAYLRDYYLEQMRKQLIPDGLESFNYHRLEGKRCTIQALSQLVDNLPMMSERTLLVVSDYDLFQVNEEERDSLTALLESLPDYCCLVFVYDIIPYKSDARKKKLTAAIRDHGQVIDFQRQSQGDLTDWIHRRFKALGKTIGTAEAQYLIFLCGDLMHGLISEIEKIGAFAPHSRITREDIDAVAIPLLDAVVFQMTDALMNRDFSRSAEVLGDLLRMQQPPIMILSVLGKHFRQLLTARLALDRGRDAGYLMELWGMRSSYPAQKLLSAARHFGLAWCRRAVIRCAETDLAMKSISGTDSQDLLICLLAELSAGEVQHRAAY